MSEYQYGFASDPLPHLSIAQIAMTSSPITVEESEDWTQITDQALRRRIQNRIAQRNYRNKLKQRLQDLETWAAAGGDMKGQAIPNSFSKSFTKTRKRATAQRKSLASQQMSMTTYGNEASSVPSARKNGEQSCTPTFPSYWSSFPPNENYLPSRELLESYPATTMTGGYANHVDNSSALCSLPALTPFSDILERQ